MSENDTIPAVLRIDHHAELRRLADLLENEHGPDDEYTGYCADHIRDHADALARRLAEAGARAERWKRYAEWMEFEDWPEAMWDEVRSRFGIDEPAESMDERITKRSQRAGDLPNPDGGAS